MITTAARASRPKRTPGVFPPFFTPKSRAEWTSASRFRATSWRGTAAISGLTARGGAPSHVVSLPVAPAERPARVERPRSRGLRILVVDDEEVIRDVLSNAARKGGLRGHTVAATAARRPRSSRRSPPTSSARPDAPRPSGLELMREIRRQIPDAVVVIVTASSSLEGASQGFGGRVPLHRSRSRTRKSFDGAQGSEARRLTEENRGEGGALEALRPRPDRRQVRADAKGLRPRPARGAVQPRSWSRARAAPARSSSRGQSTRLAALRRAVRDGDSGSMPGGPPRSTLSADSEARSPEPSRTRRGSSGRPRRIALPGRDRNGRAETQAKLLRVIRKGSSCASAASRRRKPTSESSPPRTST